MERQNLRWLFPIRRADEHAVSGEANGPVLLKRELQGIAGGFAGVFVDDPKYSLSSLPCASSRPSRHPFRHRIEIRDPPSMSVLSYTVTNRIESGLGPIPAPTNTSAAITVGTAGEASNYPSDSWEDNPVRSAAPSESRTNLVPGPFRWLVLK